MPIKVLHIIKSLGRGGAEMLLPETLKLHQKELFEFHYIYFLPWKNQMVEAIQEQGGKVVCFSANNSIQLMTKVWAVANYVRTEKIKLIHAHLPWAGILARIVGKMCAIPVIYTEHNKQERYKRGTRIMNLLTINWLTTVVAVSTDVAASIQKHKPNLKAPVRTILNGVNTSYFKREFFSGQEVRKKLHIPVNAPIIGSIAVFRSQKRLDLWLELAAKILNQFEDAHFIIVGDGPLKSDLEKKRDMLGLKDKVHMPGLETEVRPYLAAFDVYMMSSLFEGLPIALLEAMSMRCAVISTDAGGIKEVIRDNANGLLCPVEEPEKLVQYACTLLKDHNLRVKYGDLARQSIIETFSMDKMVAKIEALYSEVINQ
jgi:L-malate glycosyltransferase